MSQISPPIRILLVLAVAVLGVYMLFLRPKPEEAPPVQPAGTSVTDAPGAAQDAVDAANQQLAQQESVDGVDAGEAAAGTASGTKKAQPGTAQAAAGPAEDLTGLPKPIRKAIRADKVLVILFSNGKSYDDKAVEKALTKVNRWDGRVFVHTAPLDKISKYGRIARGASVEQSPTVVVADRDLRAETLVGYVDRTQIDQAVVDARRNSTGIYVDTYLKSVDKACFAHSNRWDSVPFFWFPSGRKADRRLARLDTIWASFVADVKSIKAPAKWRAFHSATVADLKAYRAELHSASVAVGAKTKLAAADATVTKGEAAVAPVVKRANRRFASANLPRCGSQF